MPEHWVKAISVADLKTKGRSLFRLDGKQVALFHDDNGIFACNNRCPHEGYPLSEGSVDEACTLTCNWHNWKFDLRTGANLYGGDRLRTYPVEVRGDDVWLDVAELPLEARKREILKNLRDAFDDHEYDRLARELGRWNLLGADPLEIVREAIAWSYERFEFGWTHAYAGTADWLTLYDEHAGDLESQLICLLEAIGHIADDGLRESNYPFTEERRPFHESQFLDAIEAEDEAKAVAMIRGALAAGLAFTELEGPLSRAALRHYNAFGHALIYVSKVGRLIERLGESVAAPLIISLVRAIVYAQREDKIPEFRGYSKALASWGQAADEPAAGAEAYRKLGIAKALQLTERSHALPPQALYRMLLGANAANMLGFDLSYQEHVTRPVSDNIGWLDFTHGLTFAHAVRAQCTKFPDLWPAGLLQLACFSGRNASFTDPAPDLEGWAVADPEGFFSGALEAVFDHGRDEYIVSVHILKTLLAVRDEVTNEAAGEYSELVLAALNRFLHEPLKRKHVRRTVHQALAFVARDG